MECLIYLLKVTACTVFFFGFYMVVLGKLTFFKINRFYLLASLLLSFIIPALRFEVKREMPMLETELVGMPDLKPIQPAPVQLIQPIMVEYQPEVTSKIDWVGLIPYAYGAVALLLLLICLWRLFVLLKHTGSYTKNSNGLKLITKTKGFTNCSFFNYVFINAAGLSATDLSVLLKHEQVHARQYHSIDKIILMVFKSVLWFNPIVYLYDKALEQVHEYEADEITSADYGSEAYANLLLKLAIAKSDMPLIHNFVKSPIKDRIKMLFHSKTKNMKKLIYLLALPVAVGLFWLFAVQVVYAQNIKEHKKPSKDFYKGALKGKVLDIKKEAIGLYTFYLLSEGNVYPIEATTFKEKIKVGDELIVYISAKGFNIKKTDKNGKVIAETKEPIYNATKVTTLTGSLIYEQKIENHAFLYEANKARSASSKIKTIKKDANGKIEKIVLNDGFFTINLNLQTQNIKDDNFKAGDQVLVKFIGEKLVAKNIYSTDKMIVLYSEPKKYLIKNEVLYNRFYFNDGKQKAAAIKNQPTEVAKPVMPKIISFSKITGDVQHKVSYMENAVIDIVNCRLEAGYVELDQLNGKMIAKNAVLKAKEGGSATAKIIVFNLKDGSYRAENGEGKLGVNIHDAVLEKDFLTKLNDKVEYVANDSVKMSKDRFIISLFGNARLFYKEIRLSGAKIVYNKKDNTVLVSDATMTSGDNKVKADSLFFDIKTKKAKLYGADLNR
ncbi:M56 family metallopeptidase [Pedobacter sp. P26]|uniref:M56 family metallopeptidase n=1 Tax=Pedobacter sp. P26 TaxID=3423956 RepID=UPI003D668886